MSRELHIFNLRMLREQYEAEHVDEIVETIDVAIWALQTQETLKKERDAALAMAQPEKMQLSREDATFDYISRQAAIDAARKAIWNYHGELFKEINSREDIDDVIWKIINPVIPSAIGRCADAINALPSAQPEVQQDGTLSITVDTDISQIRRVLVSQAGTQYGNMYYADAELWRGEEP